MGDSGVDVPPNGFIGDLVLPGWRPPGHAGRRQPRDLLADSQGNMPIWDSGTYVAGLVLVDAG